jgi:hypothetical protein
MSSTPPLSPNIPNNQGKPSESEKSHSDNPIVEKTGSQSSKIFKDVKSQPPMPRTIIKSQPIAAVDFYHFVGNGVNAIVQLFRKKTALQNKASYEEEKLDGLVA